MDKNVGIMGAAALVIIGGPRRAPCSMAVGLFEAEPLSWMRRSGRPLALHKLGRLEGACLS
jgi:hypothetical protein